MAKTGITSNKSGLVGSVKHYGDTIPRVNRTAANLAGWKVHQAWTPIAQSYGLSTGGQIARRKWSITDTVKGGAKASAIVSYNGAVHLIVGDTIAHIIGARLLNTRGSSYRNPGAGSATVRTVKNGKGFAGKAGRLGTGSAFRTKDGANPNRGVLGKMQTHTYTKGGAVKSERKGAKALTWGGGGQFSAYAFHRGTKGKSGLWIQSKAVAVDIGTKTFAAEHKKALAKEFVGGTKSILGALT